MIVEFRAHDWLVQARLWAGRQWATAGKPHTTVVVVMVLVQPQVWMHIMRNVTATAK